MWRVCGHSGGCDHAVRDPETLGDLGVRASLGGERGDLALAFDAVEQFLGRAIVGVRALAASGVPWGQRRRLAGALVPALLV